MSKDGPISFLFGFLFIRAGIIGFCIWMVTTVGSIVVVWAKKAAKAVGNAAYEVLGGPLAYFDLEWMAIPASTDDLSTKMNESILWLQWFIPFGTIAGILLFFVGLAVVVRLLRWAFSIKIFGWGIGS